MSEESKTYVFGNDSNSMLPALMGNCNGLGGNAWWVVIIMALLFGRNGFGNNGDLAPILGAMNGDTGRELLAQGIQGNQAAINQLAQTFNTTAQNMASALGTLNSSICQVGNQVGMSGAQVISAIQAGNMSLQQQLAQCCCDNKLLATTQGYENRLALRDQTTLLSSKIDYQTGVITEKFCDLEKREMQSKIDALREQNSTLMGQISNANQTAAITQYINQTIAPVAADVAALKAAAPPTVAVPYPQLSAVPTSYLCGLYGNFYNGSIWS